MAAANFSRDVLERTGDLIDLETVLENPPFDKVENQYFVGGFNNVNRLYNHCDWLKIGKRERCGKRCKRFYCSTHSEYVNKGSIIPLPCLCCGVGVRSLNQLCKHCEMTYGVKYK